ncbi:MAG: LysR family transcriptional regulator [Solobacterium sp.]|nr:LysR family transcriptional regulator [Solobacterium sp.]
MNTKQAEYLLAIAREGSITVAAKKLYISQPSLSQTLKQIEDDLGVTIFQRDTIPYKVTYAGEQCLEAARSILRVHDHLNYELNQIMGQKQGHLRLGISVQRSIQIIPQIFPIFIQRYPDVTIELTEVGSAALEELIISDELDLALAAIEAKSPLLTYELIEKETIGILAGKNSSLPRKKKENHPLTMKDLMDESFVSLRSGHSVRVIQDQMFHDYGLSPRIILETDSFEVARRVTLASDACMFCSDILVDGYASENGIFYPLPEYDNRRHFYACYRTDAFLPQYAKDLINITRNIINTKNNQ